LVLAHPHRVVFRLPFFDPVLILVSLRRYPREASPLLRVRLCLPHCDSAVLEGEKPLPAPRRTSLEAVRSPPLNFGGKRSPRFKCFLLTRPLCTLLPFGCHPAAQFVISMEMHPPVSAFLSNTPSCQVSLFPLLDLSCASQPVEPRSAPLLASLPVRFSTPSGRFDRAVVTFVSLTR